MDDDQPRGRQQHRQRPRLGHREAGASEEKRAHVVVVGRVVAGERLRVAAVAGDFSVVVAGGQRAGVGFVKRRGRLRGGGYDRSRSIKDAQRAAEHGARIRRSGSEKLRAVMSREADCSAAGIELEEVGGVVRCADRGGRGRADGRDDALGQGSIDCSTRQRHGRGRGQSVADAVVDKSADALVAQDDGDVILGMIRAAVGRVAQPPGAALRVIGGAHDRGVGAVAAIVVAKAVLVDVRVPAVVTLVRKAQAVAVLVGGG